MRRFRRKRNTYIFSPSFGIATASTSSALVGQGTSAPVIFDLLLNDTDAPPDVQGVYGFQRLGPRAEPDLLIAGMSGQVHWGINGNVSGQTAASNVAYFCIRAAIYSCPSQYQEGSASLTTATTGGVALSYNSADIGSSLSVWNNQARQATPGQRLYWSKTWYRMFNFGSAAGQQGYTFDSSQQDAPSSWVSMHPKKRLRGSDRLFLSIQYTVSNVNSFTGATQINLAPSLRIAGHPIRARKV